MEGSGAVIRRLPELVGCVSCGEKMEAGKLPDHIASAHLAYYPYRCMTTGCGLKWTIDGYSAMLLHRNAAKHRCKREHSPRLEEALQAIFDECMAKRRDGLGVAAELRCGEVKFGGTVFDVEDEKDEDDDLVVLGIAPRPKTVKLPPFEQKKGSGGVKISDQDLIDSVSMDTGSDTLAEFFDLSPEARPTQASPSTGSDASPISQLSPKNDTVTALFPLTAYQHWLQANFADVVAEAQTAGEHPDERALKMWLSLGDKTHWERLATQGSGRATG